MSFSFPLALCAIRGSIDKKSSWPIILVIPLAAYSNHLWALDGAQSSGVEGNNTVVPTARLWRSLSLSYGSTRHHYSEPDPLGRVDPLDSETGPIPTTQATLRWRGKPTQSLPEFVVQAQASYAQGQTS